MMPRQELIDCIKEATVELEVLVPSRDYYARSGDSQRSTIRYVDPEALIAALESGVGAA